MKMIQCKDFHIFKIKYYADKRLKFGTQPYRVQAWERAGLLNDFKWAFFERITGITYDEFLHNYFYFTEQCYEEELVEHGIVAYNNGGEFMVFIPRTKPELNQWVLDNVTLPYKVMKKYYTWAPSRKLESLSRVWRDDSYEKSEKFREAIREHKLKQDDK